MPSDGERPAPDEETLGRPEMIVDDDAVGTHEPSGEQRRHGEDRRGRIATGHRNQAGATQRGAMAFGQTVDRFVEQVRRGVLRMQIAGVPLAPL